MTPDIEQAIQFALERAAQNCEQTAMGYSIYGKVEACHDALILAARDLRSLAPTVIEEWNKQNAAAAAGGYHTGGKPFVGVVPPAPDKGRQVKPHRSGGGQWVEPWPIPLPDGNLAQHQEEAPAPQIESYTANGVRIVAGLRVRVTAPGHECESIVGDPPMSGDSVRVAMHRGHKLMRPHELEAIAGPTPEPAGGMPDVLTELRDAYERLSDSSGIKEGFITGPMKRAIEHIEQLQERVRESESLHALTKQRLGVYVDKLTEVEARARDREQMWHNCERKLEKAEAWLREAESLLRSAAKDLRGSYTGGGISYNLIVNIEAFIAAALAAQWEK